MLVTHLTDAHGDGITFTDSSMTKLLGWGHAPTIVRRGVARVQIRVERPEAFAVYALDTAGNRAGRVACEVRGDRLAFTADVRQPFGACLHYELVRAADFPISIPSIPDVRVTDSFWSARMETNRLVTVRAALDRYEEAGRLDNFRNAAMRKLGVKFNGKPFEDSDLYRILEGAFLACLAHPDSNLQARAEAIIPIIAAAQEPDGYLYTAHTTESVGPHRSSAGPTRWSRLQSYTAWDSWWRPRSPTGS